MVPELKVAIVGCGALGFRYLQAVLSSPGIVDTIVIDKSLESLKKVHQYTLGQGINSVRFSSSINDLPSHLDICIVATTAASRLSLVSQILSISRISHLLLEKVIEQCSSNCLSILKLIPTSTHAYVNLWPAYWQLPQIVNGFLDKQSPIDISVSGYQWNLASNAIHMLYLFRVLGALHIKLSFDGITAHYPQKRAGYYDCIGKLVFISDNDSTLSLFSSNEGSDPGDFIIRISQPSKYWVFSSLSGLVHSNINDFHCSIPYTSEFMTTQVLSVFNGLPLNLAPLEPSVYLQCLLLDSLESYFRRCGIVKSSGMLPIT